MPGVCPNSWQEYGCESVIQYLWGWTELLERLVLVALALMLSRVVVVIVRVSWRCYLVQRVQGADTASRPFERGRKKLVADLSRKVRSLRSIAATAPYFGLAGTCLGILDTFSGPYSGSRHRLFVILDSGVAAAFLSTAAGLLVAIPAVVSHNCLRTRIDSLESEIYGNAHERSGQYFQAPKFPLTARISKLPFAVIAVPVLAIAITGFMTFPSFYISRGFPLRLASANFECEYDGADRIIVLHITDASKVFLNSEQEDWNRMPLRLSEIYSRRVNRTLYLLADDDVPVQTVADALDLVAHTHLAAGPQTARTGTDSLHLTVRLISPVAMNARCVDKVPIGLSPRISR